MTIRRAIFALTTSAIAIGFENEAKWKTLDGGGIAADADGNPILIGGDGGESAVQVDTVPGLRAEAKRHRLAAENATKELKKFEGIDPDAARAAIDKTKDINLDDLVNKGKLDEVRNEVRTAMQADIDAANKRAEERDAENISLRLDNAFGKSEFLNDRIAVPRDFVESAYRDRFKVEDGKVVPTNANGEPLYSKKNHGEIASVDEALEIFVSQRADKDTILRAPSAGGSGNQGGGGNRGGGATIRRSEYEGLSPADKSAVGQKVAAGTMTVVD